LKYENRDIERNGEFGFGFEGKPKMDQRDTQKESRARVDKKNERDKETLGIDYILPLPWPQDCPPDKQILKQGFEVILRKNVECVDLKGGPVKYESRDPERSGKLWIGLRGNIEVELRDAQREKRVRIDGKNKQDGAKLGADCCIPLPLPQDRPP